MLGSPESTGYPLCENPVERQSPYRRRRFTQRECSLLRDLDNLVCRFTGAAAPSGLGRGGASFSRGLAPPGPVRRPVGANPGAYGHTASAHRFQQSSTQTEWTPSVTFDHFTLTWPLALMITSCRSLPLRVT